MDGIEYTHNQNNSNLIIFVHGFTGSKETWKNEDGKYFPDMLIENSDIANNFDIAYFNYFSKFLEVFNSRISNLTKKLFFKKKGKNSKNLDISSIADFMRSTIRYQCESYKNIIIIAHSMGGLVSKSFIIKEIQDIGDTKVRLFLSLAVPHKGTNLASISSFIKIKNIQINELQPLNDTIDSLNREWIKIKHPKTVYFVGEYDDVVDKNSEIAFDKEKEDAVYCNDDHISISKPKTKEELNYVAVEKELMAFIESKKSRGSIIVKKFEDDGRYDDELFVIKLIVADINPMLMSGAKQSFFNAEYLTKILNPEQLKCIEELYVKIKDLYTIYYGKYISSEIKSSNELLTKIHEKIREDNKLDISCDDYKQLFAFINSIHKTGMLHQMANQKGEGIYWGKDCEKEIEKIMNKVKSDE